MGLMLGGTGMTFGTSGIGPIPKFCDAWKRKEKVPNILRKFEIYISLVKEPLMAFVMVCKPVV